MTNRYTIGAYWRSRSEDAVGCGGRLCRFLSGLSKCDSRLSKWYAKGRSRTDSLRKEVPPNDVDYLTDLLIKGVHSTDHDHRILGDLGFSLGLWNGNEKTQAASISLTCGVSWESPRPDVSISNSVVVQLPSGLDDSRSLDSLLTALIATAVAWKPDWAGVMSRAAINSDDFDPRVPCVDWMVFVPHFIAHVPQPSSLLHLEGNGGSVIVVLPDPPSYTDPVSMQQVGLIRALLKDS